MQKTVNKEMAIGQPGQFYDATPRRATAYSFGAVALTTDDLGRVFTLDDNGNPQRGGEGKLAGILCHPHAHARLGLGSGGDILQGGNGELADLGRIIVQTAGAAKPTDGVLYDTTTGEILGAAPAGAPAAGQAVLSGAKFIFFTAAANELAVIQLGAGA